MKTNVIAYILLVSVGLVLAGCQDRPAPAPPPPAPDPAPEPEPPAPPPVPLTKQKCPPDCTVEIQLPDSDGGHYPEGFPDVFHIVQERDFEFRVSGTQIQGAVVLSFSKPVVRRQSQPGQPNPWLYTLRLNPGNNPYTIRDYAAGMCHEEDGGCKFVVINLGSPHQPSVIGSPTVVIDPD